MAVSVEEAFRGLRQASLTSKPGNLHFPVTLQNGGLSSSSKPGAREICGQRAPKEGREDMRLHLSTETALRVQRCAVAPIASASHSAAPPWQFWVISARFWQKFDRVKWRWPVASASGCLVRHLADYQWSCGGDLPLEGQAGFGFGAGQLRMRIVMGCPQSQPSRHHAGEPRRRWGGAK